MSESMKKLGKYSVGNVDLYANDLYALKLVLDKLYNQVLKY